MGPPEELLEIQPGELNFTFEVKKQSSCSVQLINKSDEYVAFKIKTTSPKRYCVRPNTGVILPRSKCEFTVTMQAQRSAPPDMQLKDKFLVQSTIVPFGSADEDILPSFFSKENGRYIEENKLRVVLVSPPYSPVLQPINGASIQDPANEAPILKETAAFKVSFALKEAPASREATALKEAPALEEIPDFQESPALKEAPALKESSSSKDQALNGAENLAPFQVKDVEDLKLKINNLESNLNKADKMIAMLREEKCLVVQEKDMLQQEIVVLRRKSLAKVQVGFPFLFVVFMALVGVFVGYLLNQ
ncbi:vesicle-associated protein 1-3-like [Iris pallida]|uniref:Vesicle-associated protein 1-3-like n=1 Tax=Iris pallida TaxID=29817 RepID=A0AAX6FEY2_IRIPA|nr:vesicle-associated protein 1-3-like [Iris pallida]